MRSYFQQMTVIRRFELKAQEMYQRAEIGGYCHLNVGEEATVVGLMDAMEERDYLFANYRVHGYAIARGLDPGHVMAELFGRTDGLAGGWGGSMHLADAESRFMGGYGIVGGQMPPATGAAMAVSHRQEAGPESEAVMCLLGEGTSATGAFHETLNLASLWGLPIVFVVINNRVGMSTPVEQASAEPELFRKAESYRFEGRRVDGDDPIAVRDAARAALKQAREEHRPFLLETMSYRLRGHSVVDPARYRTDEERAELAAKDLLPRLRSRLIEDGVLSEQEADTIERDADETIEQAVEVAGASESPDPSDLFTNAYSTEVANAPRAMPGDRVITL
ncbi:pyruvate dehydrogenase (acetyl-transferring) E1 component subunit alpha [Brachybacterium sp. P6-10-X1]|nr:pyruvate dehydrogenase (acetyl-transferring) E1 component subunit alpha [Brachybacterium sp. P6-10-X1]